VSLRHVRVWFVHAVCFQHTRVCVCDTYSLNMTLTSVISTRRVKFLHAVWFLLARMLFHHAESDFTRRVCFLNTLEYVGHVCVWIWHESDFYTLEWNTYTQSVISTRSVIWTSTNVIPTCTSVISTRMRLISTRKVRFLHAESDFTRRVCFLHTRECVWHVCVWLWRSRVWFLDARVWF
jgi:hypothetical protein